MTKKKRALAVSNRVSIGPESGTSSLAVRRIDRDGPVTDGMIVIEHHLNDAEADIDCVDLVTGSCRG